MKLPLLLLLGGIACSADTVYNFDIAPSAHSDVQADVLGTVSLPSGDGTFAADSVMLTSIPSPMFFTKSDVATWSLQLANLFTVANGQITQFTFFALDPLGNGDFNYFCFNNVWTTGPHPQPTNPTYPALGAQCPGYLAEAQNFYHNTMNQWVEDDAGLFGLAFQQPAAPTGGVNSPEPRALALMAAGLCLLAVGRRNLRDK